MARKNKFDYFDAFNRQAAIACEEADLLIEVIEGFTTAENVKERLTYAHELEHKGDLINHDMYTAIATDFITPIDRDDILDMAQSLDEIIDNIEDVIQRFYVYDVHFMHKDAAQFAQIIKKSCEALRDAMPEFANFKKSQKFKDSIITVNSFEEEADQLLLHVTRDLHTEDRDNAVRIMVWSRIYDRLERCTDSCEHVADLMGSILLKNS